MDLLVITEMKAKNGEDAIKQLSSLLFKKGYVKESYIRSVLEREEKYPTGIRLKGNINVALPHADIEHVLKAALAVAILEKPVKFRRMENPEALVENVTMVFMPALNEPHGYIKFLGSFAENVLQNPEIIKKLSSSKTPSEVSEVLEEQITSAS